MNILANDTFASRVRRPQRSRGIKRFEHLLDATEELLSSARDIDITLSMIAEKADVPLPSIYHFFPNRNAILVALAQRYHRDLGEMVRGPLDTVPDTWQEIVCRRQLAAINFLNARPAALRLFMGAGVSAEVRSIDLRGNASLASIRADEFRYYFECDNLYDLERWIAYSIGLVDGIWAISWAEDNHISESALAESNLASIAYMRSYLPERLAKKGQSIKR